MKEEFKEKSQLVDLYNSKKNEFKLVYEKYKNENINGPFLMSPSLSYLSSKTRLLVVGQETAGWEKFDDGVESLLSLYENFNVGENYKKKGSPLWYLTRFTENALGNSKHSCMWTNLSKYDQDGHKPDAKHSKDFSKFDSLLKSEIDILKPEFCLFFTGYALDKRLSKVFENLELIPVEGFEANELVQLKSPDLPELCFRTPHPKAMSLMNKKSHLKDRVETFITQNAKYLLRF